MHFRAAAPWLPIVLAASTAFAQSIQGTATYRQRMAMPPGAVFEAALEDVSHADAPADTIARTRGGPSTVSVMLSRSGSGQPAPPAAGTRALEGTYWRAIELAGKPTPARDSAQEAHLQFQPEGRVSGSDGCNTMSGTYERRGQGITFGRMAATQRACINDEEIARGFRAALSGAGRVRIAGDRLELFDAAGKRLAAFTAVAKPSAQASPLEGTSWQLVQFQGSDDTTLRPDDRTKYTVVFGAGGQ